MKKLVLYLAALFALLTACTPYIYGVPQETWDRMSEKERIQTRRAYERQEEANRRAAEEQARREALQLERERARKAEEERLRRERIEAIHRGEGAYGELIRVRLQGGRMKLGERQYRYQPVTFTIADGESRAIGVVDPKGRETSLVVTYSGGALAMEDIRIPYDRSWGSGTLYTDTGTSGLLQLRGVDLFIEIVQQHSRYDRNLPRIVLLRDEEPPVIMHEKERRERPVVPHEERQRSETRPDTRPLPPRADDHAAADAPPRAVEIAIISGEMKMRGRSVPVKPQTVRLAEGETKEVTLTADEQPRTITVSYKESAVTIDGRTGRGRGDEVTMKFEKGWINGKSYRVAIKGKGGIENLEVRISGKDGGR